MRLSRKNKKLRRTRDFSELKVSQKLPKTSLKKITGSGRIIGINTGVNGH